MRAATWPSTRPALVDDLDAAATTGRWSDPAWIRHGQVLWGGPRARMDRDGRAEEVLKMGSGQDWAAEVHRGEADNPMDSPNLAHRISVLRRELAKERRKKPVATCAVCAERWAWR